MAIKKDTLDQLLDGRDPKEVFNKDGLFDELKKALAERVLNAELDDHLESEAPRPVRSHVSQCPPVLRKNGSVGRHDTYGSALTAQPGESQRRPATNASSQLIMYIGLPALRAPGASVPDGRTIR